MIHQQNPYFLIIIHHLQQILNLPSMKFMAYLWQSLIDFFLLLKKTGKHFIKRKKEGAICLYMAVM